MLLSAVATCGSDDWLLVALFVEGRDAAQCQKRYVLTLNPALRKRAAFTAEEERILYLLVGIMCW